MDWANTTARQDEKVLVFGVPYITGRYLVMAWCWFDAKPLFNKWCILSWVSRSDLKLKQNWYTNVSFNKMHLRLSYALCQICLGLVLNFVKGHQATIIWTNAGILLIGLLGTNLSEILIEILTFSFKKICLNVLSAKWRPFCPSLNVLKGAFSALGG